MNFLSPTFLYFLPLISLPFIFHLLFKKKPVKAVFSYVPLIRMADRTLMRKKRLQDLLLLLVRCLFILFLILFFARPVLFSGGFFSQEKDEFSLVVLMDVSASMGAVESGQKTLDWAKAGVQKILSRLGPETQVGLIVYSDRVETEMAPGTERAKITALLNEIQPRALSTNVFPALQLAYAMLSHQDTGKKAILIVSDQFEGGWREAIEAEGRLENFDPEVSVMAWEAIGPVANRGAVAVNLGLSQAGALTGQWTLARSGGAPDEAPWDFTLNGATVEKGAASLGGKARGTIPLKSGLSERGAYEGVLSLKSDALPFDDKFYVAGRFPKGYRLLAVDGEPGTSPSDSEIYFFRSALETPLDPRLTSLRVVSEPEFNPSLLAETDVLLLANVPADKFQNDLLKWVEDGGRILLTAGGNWPSGSSSPTGLFNKGTVVKNNAKLSEPALDGEIMRGLSSGGEFQWSNVTVSQYVKMTPDPADKVILSFQNGDPLLVRRFRGKGEVMFLTSTLDRAWSNFAAKPVFPPLIREAAAFLGESTGRDSNLNFLAGERLRVPSPSAVKSATLIFPNGSSQGIRAGADSVFELENLTLPGIYQVKTGDPDDDFSFAVNIPNLEAEGTAVKAGERDLKKCFPGAALQLIPYGRDSSDAVLAALQGKNLTDVFLAGLIFLFGMESFLGYRRKK